MILNPPTPSLRLLHSVNKIFSKYKKPHPQTSSGFFKPQPEHTQGGKSSSVISFICPIIVSFYIHCFLFCSNMNRINICMENRINCMILNKLNLLARSTNMPKDQDFQCCRMRHLLTSPILKAFLKAILSAEHFLSCHYFLPFLPFTSFTRLSATSDKQDRTLLFFYSGCLPFHVTESNLVTNTVTLVSKAVERGSPIGI